MPAYLLALVEEVIDQDGLQQYAAGAAQQMAHFGGKYIFASFGNEPLEGGTPLQVIALAEFPDRASLQAFWSAPEYEPLRELRHRSARARIYAADVPPATDPAAAAGTGGT